MGGRPALLVNAAELLRDPGTRKHISDLVPPVDIEAESRSITGDIAVEVDLGAGGGEHLGATGPEQTLADEGAERLGVVALADVDRPVRAVGCADEPGQRQPAGDGPGVRCRSAARRAGLP